MDMKIDGNRVRTLREDRAWSQEHLAEITGLSVRTVQRIESDGNASAESRLALAAAFAVTPADLALPAPAGPVAAPPPAADAERRGRRRTRRDGVLRHALVYGLVGSGLLFLDWRGNGHIDWAYWPLLGWGLGLALHALRGQPFRPHDA